MRYWRRDCLDQGDCVGDDVVLAGYVADVSRELGDKVQMFNVMW
jgi:hypothetical protein